MNTAAIDVGDCLKTQDAWIFIREESMLFRMRLVENKTAPIFPWFLKEKIGVFLIRMHGATR